MAWRSATPFNSFGSSAKKAAKLSASNFRTGVNCQRMGPSFAPNSVNPLLRNLSTSGAPSARFFFAVANCQAFVSFVPSEALSVIDA